MAPIRLAITSICVASALCAAACSKEPARLPSHVILQEPSPSGDIIAVVYLEKSKDLLGGQDRAWLALRYPHSECILKYELTEGLGTYEGGIYDLAWLDNVEILVRRYLADRQSDIVYNTASRVWRPYAEN